MSINPRPRTPVHYWLLLVCSCHLLPLSTHSTPLPQDPAAYCAHESVAGLIRSSPVILKALGARIFTDSALESQDPWQDRRPGAAEGSILITLSPETVYKGASLLKTTPTAESAARSGDPAFLYEGQLNATLAPLSCFDGNVLKMLPTELIAFGKLVTTQQQQQQQPSQQQPHQQQHGPDILRISINGLHRWSPQFENHIWKHLGWDDWSDFTLCSVTCGKGVQQRFRRCLLDDPMVDLNMNLAEDEEEVDDEVMDEDETREARNGSHGGDRMPSNDTSSSHDGSGNGSGVPDVELDSGGQVEILNLVSSAEGEDQLTLSVGKPLTPPASAGGGHQRRHVRKQEPTQAGRRDGDGDGADNGAEDDEVMRVFKGTLQDGVREGGAATDGRGPRRPTTKKKKKKAKSFSTMFCEGYNIEQRNCNTFECSDDISDLLKFYKKFPAPEDASTASAANEFPTTAGPTSATPAAASSAASTAAASAGAAAATTAAAPSTPANMGFVRSWHNGLNFTLMMTLRVKNDTRARAAATIFSIRNSTHNLYLEPSGEGLRLYLERDNSTEMLSVRFHLHDYRWHQVAISVHNGDFISVFVDCSWTNSFVVSKRLFALPLDADVEIGRGFNGELQQLLVLPNNQERHQCSTVRTSINEVKRYIIDTFIDDYGN